MKRNIINNHTIEIRDDNDNLKYTEKGGGIAYLDNGTWKETTNTFAPITDPNYIFKNDEGDAKVYIGKELIGTIKYEKDEVTYLSSFIGLGYCSESGEDFEIFDAPDDTAPVLDGDRALFTALQYGYVEYEKIYGEFIQRIVIPDKALLPVTTKEYICAVTEFNIPLLDILDDQKIIRKFIIKDNKNYLVEIMKISEITTSEIIINYSTKSSALTANEIWSVGTYYINGQVILGAYNLTLDPDVIIKSDYTGGTGIIQITGSGIFTANGTKGHEIYITSKHDDIVGEIISGSTGSPAPVDWGSIWDKGNSDSILNYTIIRYGGNPGAFQSAYCTYPSTAKVYFNNCIFEMNRRPIHLMNGNPAKGIILDGCIFKSNWEGGGVECMIQDSYATSHTSSITNCIFWKTSDIYGGKDYEVLCSVGNWTIKNCLFKKGTNTTWHAISIAGWGTTQTPTVLIQNCTIDGNYNDSGIIVGGLANLTIKDCIITNGKRGIWMPTGTPTIVIDYNNIWNNTSGNFVLVTPGANDIQVNPMYNSRKIGELAFYLDQVLSPCIDAGSQTAVAAELDDKGTSGDNITLDTGIVDMGYHYTYEIVEPPVPSGVVNIAY